MTEIVKTNGLTNTEIAAAPKHMLGAIQKQVRFLMERGMVRKACPSCGEPHNLPEARRVSVDEYDFGSGTQDRHGPCRGCGRMLVYTLPWPTGDWHWRLDTNEGKRAA